MQDSSSEKKTKIVLAARRFSLACYVRKLEGLVVKVRVSDPLLCSSVTYSPWGSVPAFFQKTNKQKNPEMIMQAKPTPVSLTYWNLLCQESLHRDSVCVTWSCSCHYGYSFPVHCDYIHVQCRWLWKSFQCVTIFIFKQLMGPNPDIISVSWSLSGPAHHTWSRWVWVRYPLKIRFNFDN